MDNLFLVVKSKFPSRTTAEICVLSEKSVAGCELVPEITLLLSVVFSFQQTKYNISAFTGTRRNCQCLCVVLLSVTSRPDPLAFRRGNIVLGYVRWVYHKWIHKDILGKGTEAIRLIYCTLRYSAQQREINKSRD